jgi:anti-anti-sigma factor
MVEESRERTRSVIKPSRNLVGVYVQELRQSLKSLVEQGVRELVIDLTGVEMVDSTGIGLLVSAHNSLKKAGGQLEVINSSKDLLDMFRWMRLHQHFSIAGLNQPGIAP